MRRCCEVSDRKLFLQNNAIVDSSFVPPNILKQNKQKKKQNKNTQTKTKKKQTS